MTRQSNTDHLWQILESNTPHSESNLSHERKTYWGMVSSHPGARNKEEAQSPEDQHRGEHRRLPDEATPRSPLRHTKETNGVGSEGVAGQSEIGRGRTSRIDKVDKPNNRKTVEATESERAKRLRDDQRAELSRSQSPIRKNEWGLVNKRSWWPKGQKSSQLIADSTSKSTLPLSIWHVNSNYSLYLNAI